MWTDWPIYSQDCRADMNMLLARGGSLSAYQANKDVGIGPKKGSWAWLAERQLEAMHGVRNAIVCSNGTVALASLVRAMGQQVFTVPALTFSATVHGAGDYVRFGDVLIPECTLDQREGINFHPGMQTEVYGPCLPVDLFGRQAQGFSKNTIVDASQAIGLVPLTDHGVWSFNGRKQVPAGEGGAIYTNDDAVAEKCRLLLNHAENFGCPWTSGNGRMSEQTALLVWHGLRALPERQQHRRTMAKRLGDILVASMECWVPKPEHHALYVYPLVVPHSMPKLAKELQGEGIACQPGYIQPTLDQYLAFKGYPHGPLTNTHSLSRDRLILFPQVTPTVTEDEIDSLGENIVKAWRKLA